MSDEHLNDNVNSRATDPLAAALASFTPAAGRIDRDRLMFLAGQASAMASGGCQAPGNSDSSSNLMTGKLTHPARLAWPASTAALAATALALAIMLGLRSEPKVQT